MWRAGKEATDACDVPRARPVVFAVVCLTAVWVTPLESPAEVSSRHAHFESGQRHGFSPGAGVELAVVDGDARQGRHALAIDVIEEVSPGAALAHRDGLPFVGPAFVTLWLKGRPGNVVQLQVAEARSAPVRLDGTWQVGAVRVDAAPNPRIDVMAVEAQSRGDRIVVDDGRVAPSLPSTSAVRDGTRVVLVNDQPFVARGYTYWPLAIGLHWPASTWADPAACQQDARLLGTAGVTLLRIPYEDHAPEVADRYLACLDAFHANGIGVLWLIGPPTQLETIPDVRAWTDLYAEKVVSAVDTVGDHPATLLWTIGNELERSGGGSGPQWLGNRQTETPGLLENLIQVGKAAEVTPHLWGTTLCCPSPTHWMQRGHVPSLDFWGLNAYHQTHNLGDPWYAEVRAADPDGRPAIITETGTDRYFCFPQIFVDTIVQTCRTVHQNPAAHSGERQSAQRDWNLRIWDRMEPNLATPTNPDGAVFGVTYFMWSDLWWFSLGFLTPQSPANRQVGGIFFAGPDNVINIELMGVANAQTPGTHPPRVTSLAFDALAARWAPMPPPVISEVQATVGGSGTQITVSWRTSEAATSEVQAGVNGEDGRDGGTMREDNTIFGLAGYDPVLRTEHSLTIDAATLDSVLCQKVVARSFTADGRSATTAPVIVGCPSTGRTG